MKSLENLPSRAAIEAEIERRARSKISQFYPDTGPLRRDLYKKHLSFFRAGKEHRERLMIAGNRSGKSTIGAYEMTCHLTGRYPPWWEGRRFGKPIKAWACGESGKKVREVVQEKLFGPPNAIGTGMIPGEYITSRNMKAGVPDAIDTAWIQHISGGHSLLTLKSYEQRREGFDGDAIEVIWLDEEATVPIYTECLLRSMTTGGLLLLTFTPLSGLTELVQLFLPGGTLDQTAVGSRFVVSCTWDEVPHLSPEVKEELWASIPPYQRDARSKGIPQLGSGAIYPVPESDVVIADFQIPDHWPRAYALDVGWNKTAAIWGAQDPETATIYLYSEYYRAQAEPVIHAEAIKARGSWIPGVIDPAARGRSQRDGSRLMQCYQDLGLDLQFSENAVEAGLYEVWQLLSSGKLKVFESCQNWREEFRLYRRNEDGKIVKERDHLMDCTKYLCLSGRDRMRALPVKQKPEPQYRYVDPTGSGLGWMR